MGKRMKVLVRVVGLGGPIGFCFAICLLARNGDRTTILDDGMM